MIVVDASVALQRIAPEVPPAEGFELIAARVELQQTDVGWLGRSLYMALEMSRPIYDCIYLALAERLRRQVLTADREFLSRTRRASFGHLVLELPKQ